MILDWGTPLGYSGPRRPRGPPMRAGERPVAFSCIRVIMHDRYPPIGDKPNPIRTHVLGYRSADPYRATQGPYGMGWHWKTEAQGTTLTGPDGAHSGGITGLRLDWSTPV